MSRPPLTFAGWLRYAAVRRVLRELDGVESVLEIGAGQGALGVRLASAYEYVGVEPDRVAYTVAAERFAAVGRGVVLEGGVDVVESGRTFDLLCAFEVLEHIEDSVGELESWRTRLARGRWMLLTVPAGRKLGAADRRVGHRRRYDPESLKAEITAAGLTVISVERFGFPLANALDAARNLTAFLQQTLSSREVATGGSGRWLQPPDSLAWATRFGTAPFRRFPVSDRGPSLLALARNSV